MTRRLIERPAQIYSASLGGSFRPIHTGTDTELPVSISKKTTLTIITTSLLIPGDGEPIKDAALVISSKLIAWVGPQSAIPKEYTDSPHKSYSTPYLMPGLWDCHAHFGGESPDAGSSGDPYQVFITEHPAASGARLTRMCWLALQRGYTSLRDVAGMGCEISRAIEDGTIVGPNVYSSGACISQLAGHGDIFSLPAGDVLLNLGVSQVTAGHFGTASSMIVDGVDECRRAVRLQIRRGAKCIKVMASGGVMSRDDNPLYAQFSPAELETIVEEANRQNRVVAAHVHGKPGIMAAIKAGVTTLEHVSFADRECIDLIKEKGIIYIATRLVMDLLLGTGGKGIPPTAWEKVKLCATNHLAAYKMAIEAGIPIALGTDTGPGFNMAMELEAAVKAGMSNLEAIKAATANGPLSVGGQAPKTGQLKAGYEADVLGLLENPVEDVRVLQKIENVAWVWKGGSLFKGPGVGPWGEDPTSFDEWSAATYIRS
ncbi:amidohydrolase [Colletotrichum scovillei]|uniref:Amidohydrolase n=1 Tax=Colletotrichum scovillei TaxID=1209932 RepID=A0A9P7U3A8_9PEZI|nr:amidohydrolase [Colletotrichum scovillei]KAG7040496.1 amidohydrolase [Colletotrichum scovillei]KAG7060544.1 amidohydrolase [Colletotrichum scovillei]